MSDPRSQRPRLAGALLPVLQRIKEGRALSRALATAAVALPMLLAFNLPPSATLLNQAAAVVGWSAWLLALAAGKPSASGELTGAGPRALLSALVVLAVAAPISSAWGGVPDPLRLSSAAMLAAAALVVAVAQRVPSPGHLEAAFESLCVALVVAGALSTVVAIPQVFMPQLTGSDWIPASAIPGRASGNLRQPNHLASVLLWAIVAAVWFLERAARDYDTRRAPAVAVLGGGLVFGLVLTASRTGALGLLLLAVWGLFDSRLAKGTRLAVALGPLLYAAIWWLVDALMAVEGTTAFAGAQRLHEADPSGSRFAIWSNTIELIGLQPWTGVGWGNFNFAWTLTEFSHRRPVAFFDHTHNLALQLWVELGLPLGTLVLALLGYALWRAFRAAAAAHDAETALAQRCAFMIVLLAMLHTMVEYPLWYAHFLFPVAFCWGLCLARPVAPAPGARPTPPPQWADRLMSLGGVALLAGGIVMVWDYFRVVPIFDPPAQAAPLRERIAEGQRSWFFAHHADYALVTTYKEPMRRLDDFRRPVHFLLDARLMQAWAEALAAAGEVDRARWVARRLAEFHRPQSQAFFAPCSEPVPLGASRPFQCEAPLQRYSFEDFR